MAKNAFKRLILIQVLLGCAAQGTAQLKPDTLFVRDLGLNEVRNISVFGENLYFRRNDSLFIYQSGKGAFLSVVQGLYSEVYFDNSKRKLAIRNFFYFNHYPQVKVNPRLLPGQPTQFLSSGRIGSRYFVAHNGRILEYRIYDFYKVHFNGTSVRSIRGYQDRIMVGTYNGVYNCDLTFNQKLKIQHITYVNGEINVHEGHIYFNQDPLKVYNAKNNSADILELATDGNHFRKLIQSDTTCYALRTNSIDRISLENGYRNLGSLNIRSRPTDLEFDSLLYYGNEAGEIATLERHLKVSAEPILDLDLDSGSIHIVSGNFYTVVGKKDFNIKSRIDLHTPIFEIILHDGDPFLLTKNGLYFIREQKLYQLIANVEFNNRAAYINNSKLYLGSTYGLFEIDEEVLRKTVIPNLEYVEIKNEAAAGQQSGVWKPLAISGMFAVATILGALIYYVRRRKTDVPEIQSEFSIEIIRKLIEEGTIKNVNELAAYFKISRVTLNKRFNGIGMAPNEIVRDLKIKRVQTLYQTGAHTISQVAEIVGYSESVIRKILKNS